MKRITRWKHKDRGLVAFLAAQHQAYRTKGFEHIGHWTEPGAFRLARTLDKSGRNVLLIATGETTTVEKIPIYDVYRAYRH